MRSFKKIEARFQRASNGDPAPRWSERNQDITQYWHAESALQWFRW